VAHCASEDLKMSAGVAKELVQRDPGLKLTKPRRVGEASIIIVNNRLIFTLITKAFFHSKPNYQDFESSLISMRNFMVFFKIKRLAIPKLGSGLDKLNWELCLDLIIQTFIRDSVEIVIFARNARVA